MDTLVRVQIDKFRIDVRMLAELEELVWKTKEVNGGADVIVKKDGIEEIRDRRIKPDFSCVGILRNRKNLRRVFLSYIRNLQ